MSRSDNHDSSDFTLVLGGGGVAGIAWMIGAMSGLADRQVRLDAAQRVIGTSAGAVAGAQLLSGLPVEELFERQVDPARQAAELTPDQAALDRVALLMPALRDTRGRRARHALVTQLLEAPSFAGEAERRAIIAGRLPLHQWPLTRFEVTAMDLVTGELRLFDRNSGVPLVDAVTASCALPGLWPAVMIGGKRYVDGGVRSAENADLAIGARFVVILAPNGVRPEDVGGGLAVQAAMLEAQGATVLIIEPDAVARADMGANALDPAVRNVAAQAGRSQGRRDAERARELLAQSG